ncbi:Polyphosphate kinase 2 (PPK2) [Aquimixticola soesokkakensis]|uniref:ADP/GDP-polyphosphate phosphotransferase n=1 Tax=Aquimixticola soesokkakensis TaxID=1519096 RepID=A0A1Y5SLK5_9RHOB|nr:polyphosphate kinase 2 [Aquimixticola soesokkakensis]SLN42428.1 Polyphosphate kinase 2 (PPK2) [Aquimixticola soesokkakensis]
MSDSPDTTDLPFDGAISAYFENEAPKQIRQAVQEGDKKDILRDTYPYARWMKKKDYEADLQALQFELVKMLAGVKDSGKRVVVLFEGRDAAGKGGAIKRVRENLNTRAARVVALSKPTQTESGQWYFQRYLQHLPSAGEITLFDRSWYNRAVVEKVFGFCDDTQRETFFRQLPNVENTLIDDGIILIKIWLNVGRAEQLRRFLQREKDPLKHWKLSSIDIGGLSRWEAYSDAIAETFARSHTPIAPWTVVLADDKYRARLNVIRAILSRIDYPEKDDDLVQKIDPAICAGPDIWHA